MATTPKARNVTVTLRNTTNVSIQFATVRGLQELFPNKQEEFTFKTEPESYPEGVLHRVGAPK